MITTNMENQLQYNVHVHGSLKCPGLDIQSAPVIWFEFKFGTDTGLS